MSPSPEPITARFWLRRSVRWALVVIAAVVILVRCTHGGGSADKARGGFAMDGRPIAVVAETAQRGDLPIYFDALGTVTPLSSVLVRTRVDGQLLKVEFREGQMVHKGERLARIDPRPYQVQLQQARGTLARDIALLHNARVDLGRYTTLWQQDSIARQELDTQKSLVKQYEGAVETDRGAIASAQLDLSYTDIRAPISGRVGLRQVDPGNQVRAADTTGIVLITQEQPIGVVFAIPEEQLDAVLKALKGPQPLPVEAWDRQRSRKLATGRVLTVDNQIDTSTGTVKVKAQFANTDDVLFPNQFVNVRLHVATVQGATLIPSNAVQRGSQGIFVYAVQKDDTVKLQPVVLGQASGDQVVVTSGLQPGVKVVVDGVDKLRDGARVELVTPDGQPAGSAREAASDKRTGTRTEHRAPARAT